MKYFLSCDWGTTRFRLRLAEDKGYKIISEEASGEGIAAMFAAWQKSGLPEEKRVSFYLDVLKTHISGMEDKLAIALSGIPVIISGMASSSIGLMELPYSPLPVNITGESIITAMLHATEDFGHDVLLISGVRTDDDVIRGEETQLVGCAAMTRENISDELFIFPGTHSKHIHVADGQITGIKTYMTGEFFGLLSSQSILRTSVEHGGSLADTQYFDSFKQGVNDALNANLLNAAFKVRTNTLFDKHPKKENFCYLSGLLIAAELNDLSKTGPKKINLLCTSGLLEYYAAALDELGFSFITRIFDADLADGAVVRGQYLIYEQAI